MVEGQRGHMSLNLTSTCVPSTHIIYIKIVQGLDFFGSTFHSLDLFDLALMRIKEMETMLMDLIQN